MLASIDVANPANDAAAELSERDGGVCRDFYRVLHLWMLNEAGSLRRFGDTRAQGTDRGA
jgi:hypothetical protein